jgi:hypothetical protein
MSPEQIAELRVLVARRRAGRLQGPELAHFQDAFRTLERSLNQAQLLLAPRSAQPRRSFRVTCSLDVDLALRGVRHRGRVQSLSLGGFSAVVAERPEVGAGTGVALWFPPQVQPFEAHAVCRAGVPLGSRWRGCFEFVGLSPEQRERLQLEVLDLVLELLWPAPMLQG